MQDPQSGNEYSATGEIGECVCTSATAMIKNVPKSNQSSSCFISRLSVVKLQTVLPKACLPDLNKSCAERENYVSSWCCCSLRLLCLQRLLFVFLVMELLLVAL